MSINRMLAALRSRVTFYVILAIFTLQSLWIALSARYPMAFDEHFHYGVIKLHSQTWLPFFKTVPAEASTFGAIGRDPSFLFHYLMSFPYRLIALLTDSLAWQVIIMRCMNIGMVVVGLLIFRKLLLRLGLDSLRANIVIGFFTLIPILPLMAAQVSYDNLVFLLSAVVLLLAAVFLQRHRANGRIDVSTLTWLLITCLFASMVKYAFLPVFFAVVLCLAVVVIRNWQQTLQAYKRWWSAEALRVKVLIFGMLLVGMGLFAGSYGINLIRYHSPVPRCDTVLSVEACAAYAPWNRDYVAAQTYAGSSLSDIPPYIVNWFRQMMHETFFEVTSLYEGNTVVYYVTQPLPILYVTAWVLAIIGTLALLFNYKLIWQNPVYRLMFVVLFIYCLALFKTNFVAFWKTGVPVAIHGRYLLPIILPIIAIAVVCVGRLLSRLSARAGWSPSIVQRLKFGSLVLVFLLCLQGGGLISFIISSNDGWIWQQSQPALQANRVARKVLWLVIYKHQGNY